MDRKANFKVLEGIFVELERTSAKWMVRNNYAVKPVKSSVVPWTAVGLSTGEQQSSNHLALPERLYNQ